MTTARRARVGRRPRRIPGAGAGGAEPLVWGRPPATGLFRHVAELPIDRQPGSYELRVRRAEKGEERVIRAPFEIAAKN